MNVSKIKGYFTKTVSEGNGKPRIPRMKISGKGRKLECPPFWKLKKNVIIRMIRWEVHNTKKLFKNVKTHWISRFRMRCLHITVLDGH